MLARPLLLSLALACLLMGRAVAQAPSAAPGDLAYRTEVVPTGVRALDTALAAASQLVALQEVAPTSAIGVLSRAEGDRARLARALESEGYWGGVMRIEVAGRPLGDPGLGEALDRAGAGPVPVRVVAEPGTLYTVATVSVRPEVPEAGPAVAAAAAQPFGLAPGDPARADPVLAAERALVNRLLASGHPLATVANRDTVVDHDRKAMEVTWRLAPGPLARFAPPAVEGETRVDRAFLRRYAGRLADEPYSPDRLEKARRDIAALGAFDSVRSRAAERLDETGRLPVTFTVADRARRAFGVTAAYETNYGPTAKVYWEHRNLFGGAERLRLEAEVARLGQAASEGGATYRVGASYRTPGLLGRDLALVVTAAALRERLDPYDRDAITGSVLLERRLSERLTVQAGPVADFGRIGPPGGQLQPYRIVGVLFGGRYDGTDSLLDPARGYRLSGTVTPSYSLRDSQPFLPVRVTGSTYWDVLGDRRTILAARGSLGALLGADRDLVPRHQRLYAGGGGSVRGYDYQSIGPRDARGRPAGGNALLETSLELRQRVYGDFGAAVFVDAGAVGAGVDTAEVRVGAGVGVRYYTAIGPIRVDAAVPLVRQQGSSGYGLYVGIGQAF